MALGHFLSQASGTRTGFQRPWWRPCYPEVAGNGGGGEAGPGLAKRTLTEWHDGSSREGDVCSRVPGMNPGTPVEGNEE